MPTDIKNSIFNGEQSQQDLILSRAPIKEAIVDIGVDGAVNMGLIHPTAIETGNLFSKAEVLTKGSIGIKIGPGIHSQTPGKPESLFGYRLRSNDGKNVAQLRSDGLTFSRLEPYQSWTRMLGDFLKVWQQYQKATDDCSITHVSIRNINVLEIPLPFDSFTDYLSAPPDIPPNLPQSMTQFLTRIALPHPDNDSTAYITQAFNGVAEGSDTLSITLDVDVVNQTLQNTSNTELLLDKLGKLRIYKNQIFFQSITDKMLEKFK